MHRSPARTAIENRARRDSGSALVIALIGIGLMLALTGSMTMVLVADAQVIIESSQQMSAFFLAESGFEAARYEIGESRDPDNDGVGTVNANKLDGSYSVAATDMGGGLYELTSTGMSGTASVTYRMITRKTVTTRFPPGAMAILGHSQDVLVDISSGVTMDGGDSPGIVLTDQSEYDAISSRFVTAVGDGVLQSSDITGSPTNIFQPGVIPLSIQHAPGPAEDTQICNEVFTDFVSHMRSVYLPSLSGSQLPGTSTITYGTSASPVTVYLDSSAELAAGQSLSGNGTLIVTNGLMIRTTASLNWTGNLIVLAAADQDAWFVNEGTALVNGNLLVVSGNQKVVHFHLQPGQSTTMNGALTLMSDFTTTGKIDLKVHGALTVNGLLTMLAVEHLAEFENPSQFLLNGAIGFGPAIDPAIDSKLVIKFNGDAALSKDAQAIEMGAVAMVQLDSDLGKPLLGAGLTHSEMTSQAWYRFYP